MPSITVDSLLRSYPYDKLNQTKRYRIYSTLLDRMFYEITYFNKYFLLGVTQIEGDTEITMDLLRQTEKKAFILFYNSNIPNIITDVNNEYRLLRRMIISVNFDIDMIQKDETCNCFNLFCL